nr:MAG TPA: hypothetical protein [Caudoviricetes sp.]
MKTAAKTWLLVGRKLLTTKATYKLVGLCLVMAGLVKGEVVTGLLAEIVCALLEGCV